MIFLGFIVVLALLPFLTIAVLILADAWWSGVRLAVGLLRDFFKGHM